MVEGELFSIGIGSCGTAVFAGVIALTLKYGLPILKGKSGKGNGSGVVITPRERELEEQLLDSRFEKVDEKFIAVNQRLDIQGETLDRLVDISTDVLKAVKVD